MDSDTSQCQEVGDYMRISELARRSGVPVGTVKYYLRERLLSAGVRTSPTQAQYGEEHVARLALIRALLGTGGLSISTARDVLAQIDDPEISVNDLLGAAHCALPTTSATGADVTQVRELLDRWGWEGSDETPAVGQLAGALEALAAAEFDVTPELLDRYARAAAEIAEGDVDNVPMHSPDAAIRHVVIGTLLLEPVLLALRRIAQGVASGRRFSDDPNRPLMPGR